MPSRFIPVLLVVALGAVVIGWQGVESLAVAISVPAVLLAVVVVGYLDTVFEPYRAMHGEEGARRMAQYKNDGKLRTIAAWWTERLYPQVAGTAGVQDHPFYATILQMLAERRFINGDDPGKLSPQGKFILRAIAVSGQKPTRLTTRAMRITPAEVRADGAVVWQGEPRVWGQRLGPDAAF